MEYNKVINYTITESYPSILIHKIPLISILLFLVYFLIFIYYFFYHLYIVTVNKKDKLKSFLTKFKYYFVKRKEVYTVIGNTNETSYDISESDISHFDYSSEVNSIERETVKIKILYKKEAFNELKKLIKEGYISEEEIKYLPKLNKFILKVEEISFSGDLKLKKKVYITKNYNIAVIKTIKIFKYLKLI